MVVIAGILFFSKGLKYGVDFRGGAEIQVAFSSDVQIDAVRSSLKDGGLEGVEVQKIGDDPSKNEFLIKVASSEKDLSKTAQAVSDVFAKTFGSNFTLLKDDIVGPKAGEQLRLSGFQALFWAVLVIFIYVTMRFDSRFAPGAVVALIHDAIFLIFVWVLTGKDFTLQTVAAILAIIGYSVNDTVVIYDRIREDLALHPDMKLIDVINKALNETLGRTVMTTITTLCVVTALFLLGGGVIKEFAFALLVGNLAGVYSTVFVASNITILMDKFWEWRKKNQKSQPTSKGAMAGAP
jgi:preprotein translocase subunit SecF